MRGQAPERDREWVAIACQAALQGERLRWGEHREQRAQLALLELVRGRMRGVHGALQDLEDLGFVGHREDGLGSGLRGLGLPEILGLGDVYIEGEGS